VQVVANLAINPGGREKLQVCLESLRILITSRDPEIVQSATEAITRVEWVP
jgi:hypothetical protein